MAKNQPSFGAAAGLFSAPARQPSPDSEATSPPSRTAKGRPRKRDGLIQKTYYITPEQDYKLKIAKVEEGREMSEIIREAIELYFER